ncbi:MAG: hypothetical protein H7070_16935 [Saprospiraceae bacterium]|nr:hypothetical protein [Pyrinomonadaceae bacterium]
MKKIIFSTLLSIFCLMTVTLISTTVADGQVQGRYINRYSKRDVSGIINRLEQSSNTFRNDFDRAMDQSNLNGTPTEDRFNADVTDYANSLDRLRRDFDRNDSWWESRNNVQNVVREAQPVNVMMNSLPFRRQLESRWNRMRTDLNTLADTYDLPGLNGGGWNGGGGNPGGGQQGNVPNWALGTFYGRGPQGESIALTIARNGSVTANINGSPSYGSINRDRLNINGENARVTRINNGIRTTGANGEVITYSKSNNGGWNPGGGGQQGNVPNWALGTFYGRGPQGESITLTISNNGSVTANIGGSASYGSIYGDRLNMGGEFARVTRLNNGIRTVGDNGQRIDYTRGR